MIFELIPQALHHSLLCGISMQDNANSLRYGYVLKTKAFHDVIKSNYIQGKFCMSVCVSVRYRTYLNIVGMGSKLLGDLERPCSGPPLVKCLKTLFEKSGFLNGEQKENGLTDGSGNKNRNGGGNGNRGGNGKHVRPEQSRVPPTSLYGALATTNWRRQHLVTFFNLAAPF
jgi:hypothetical protein